VSVVVTALVHPADAVTLSVMFWTADPLPFRS